jgi:hypothetical protein
VIRHVKTLVEDGYLIDRTPDLRNAPHTYADAGRLTLKASIGVTQSDSGVSQSDSGSHAKLQQGVTESDLKKEVKKQRRNISKKEDNGASAPPPTPPEKPKRGKREKKAEEPTVPQEQLRAMVTVLGEVTVTDLKIPNNYSRLCKDAKQLCLAGYTPEIIRRVYGKKSVWYILDWRGQKGEPPTPPVILETIAKYKDAQPNDQRGKPYAGGPSIATNPPIETPEEREANQLATRERIRAAKAKRAQSQQEAAHAAH